MVFIDQKRIRELVEKGKQRPLSNKELMELVSLLGPEKVLKNVSKNK